MKKQEAQSTSDKAKPQRLVAVSYGLALTDPLTGKTYTSDACQEEPSSWLDSQLALGYMQVSK